MHRWRNSAGRQSEVCAAAKVAPMHEGKPRSSMTAASSGRSVERRCRPEEFVLSALVRHAEFAQRTPHRFHEGLGSEEIRIELVRSREPSGEQLLVEKTR